MTRVSAPLFPVLGLIVIALVEAFLLLSERTIVMWFILVLVVILKQLWILYICMHFKVNSMLDRD